jgi:O-antigen/teichoic acid export membrane protein
MDDDSGRMPLSAVEIQRRAVSGSLWTAINTLVFLPTAFLANAVIARTLGVSDYGHLAFLTAVYALALPLTNFGFTIALLQRGSRAEAAGDRSLADELLQRSLGFHVAVQLPLLLVIVIALTVHDGAFEIAALLVAVVLSCVLSSGALSMTIENRTAAGAKIAIVSNTLTLAAAVIAALATSSASAVWAARTVVPAALLVANFAFLDALRRRRALRPRMPSFDRSFWRFALLSWAAGLLGLLVFSRSEIFLLRAFHQHEGLGWFAVAFGLSQQMTAPVDALLLPLLPAVAGLLASWPERVEEAFDRSTRISSVGAGVVAAVIVPVLVFGIRLVYGADFGYAAWLFLPLAIVSLLQSVNNPISAFVNAREWGAVRLRATSTALVVNVAVAVGLIPVIGVWGAVIANAAGQLVAIALLAAAEPTFRRRPSAMVALYLPFALGLLSLTVALGVGVAVSRVGHGAALLLAGASGAATYVTLLRVSAVGLTDGDEAALVAAVSPRMEPFVRRALRPFSRRPKT